MTLLLVMLGGAIGATARYSIVRFIEQFNTNNNLTNFPIAILLINIIGCFLFGLLLGFSNKYFVFNDNLKTLVFSGILASFTTFSTFNHELLQLIQNNNYLAATNYLFLSVIIPLIVMLLALTLAS
jgi:fluoride exporter